MGLQAGDRLGAYQILGKLGEGGMGEVYRARDTALNRDVALKVLPALFANDADRLARFTREAQVLASLNHPNIAAIYGIESTALVMELVDGDDLAAIIARGPMPLERCVADCHADRPRARSGARTRHRSSGSETRKHQDQSRRHPSKCSTSAWQRRSVLTPAAGST
jgi:serine/threonine protein kinase